MNRPPRLAISLGDLAGIGTEIIFKSLADEAIRTSITPIIYGSRSFLAPWIDAQPDALGPVQFIDDSSQINSGAVHVMECWDEKLDIPAGEPTRESGHYAFLSLDRATQDLITGAVDALVTAPIDKHNIQSEAFDFPGHTEYLAQRSGNPDHLMLLVSSGLRVGVVTGHIPVSAISEQLSTEKILSKLAVIHSSLQADFGIEEPRIAVLGLNPHAGDQGLIGTEDDTVVAPAIRQAQSQGIGAEGPFPADGFFGSKRYEDYDAILAMYHDQGLIPFKALSFGSGVNFTAGLPILRTSPDHGTAFDIAGQDQADASSFKQALILARDIAERRKTLRV
ncbi:MAG: 4-hydroxythreonine-4-phosphate dehydrogenase PdxA [Flavobacteriales bacterium]|nr:4-hydroxythreonine-4-phosphate dehydrogenase PdxA [Flavobacteriales bacterium]